MNVHVAMVTDATACRTAPVLLDVAVVDSHLATVPDSTCAGDSIPVVTHEASREGHLAPVIDAIAGMKRCISLYSGICFMTFDRNALREHPLSFMGTPVTFPISQFAICEGIFRVTNLS